MSLTAEGDLAMRSDDLPVSSRRGFILSEAAVVLLLAVNLVFGALHPNPGTTRGMPPTDVWL
jgi:hypothetical protein